MPGKSPPPPPPPHRRKAYLRGWRVWNHWRICLGDEVLRTPGNPSMCYFFNFSIVLVMSLIFFEAQKSGRTVYCKYCSYLYKSHPFLTSFLFKSPACFAHISYTLSPSVPKSASIQDISHNSRNTVFLCIINAMHNFSTVLVILSPYYSIKIVLYIFKQFSPIWYL